MRLKMVMLLSSLSIRNEASSESFHLIAAARQTDDAGSSVVLKVEHELLPCSVIPYAHYIVVDW